MILEYDGQIVDFFDKFPSKISAIGVQLSGGADSSLMLYLLVKMIQNRNDCDRVKIYPIVCYDVQAKNIDEPNVVANVIKWIEHNTGCDFITPMSVTPFFNPLSDKTDVIRANRLYLKQKYNCEFTLDGISMGMPHSSRPDIGDWRDDAKIWALNDMYPHEFPWSTVTKRFISEQYKKFDINELSKLTNSCTISSTVPCKECWWCRERYWAFNSYDGGLQ